MSFFFFLLPHCSARRTFLYQGSKSYPLQWKQSLHHQGRPIDTVPTSSCCLQGAHTGLKGLWRGVGISPHEQDGRLYNDLTAAPNPPEHTVCAEPLLTAGPALSEGTTCVLSRSVMSDSLESYGRQPSRLLCPWDSPGKNTGVGCHAFLQGIFLTQGSNPRLLRIGRQVLYHQRHLGGPQRWMKARPCPCTAPCLLGRKACRQSTAVHHGSPAELCENQGSASPVSDTQISSFPC